MTCRGLFLASLIMLGPLAPLAQADRFTPADIFKLQWASDPRIAPDGKLVVYERNFMDEMKDRRRSNLWLVDTKGKNQRPLTTGDRNDTQPRWSPDGDRIAYIARGDDGRFSLMCQWLKSGATARLAPLASKPDDIAWSPDGKQLAFSMHVETTPKPFITMPAKPKGAEWAEPSKEIRNVRYRHDGQGYLKPGHAQIFVVSSEGGPPRQVTKGPFHHRGRLSWTPDGKFLIFSANRRKDADYEPLDTEIHEVEVATGKIKQLTDRRGPDNEPTVSADGKLIAFVGFDDKRQGYQNTELYVMNRDGSDVRSLTKKLDRSVRSPVWHGSGTLIFLHDDRGDSKIAGIDLASKGSLHFGDGIGGTTLGRPYASGSFSVARENLVLAYTKTRPGRPADVAVGDFIKLFNGVIRTLTDLNADLFKHKQLGKVEEIKYKSSHDKREIQGWIVKPPDFDANKKYPLILEIHGGPFANYGPRFSAEMQLYATAGYVVFYANPRGSTGYGAEFGNLIHHNYPGEDYDDLMSGVDAVIKKGFIDDKRALRHGRLGRRRPLELDHRQDQTLQGGRRLQAGHQLVQLHADGGCLPVLRQVLVPGQAVGESGSVSETVADLAGRQHRDADHDHDRRARPPHAHQRIGTALPGPQATEDRRDAGARAGGVASHRPPAQPAHRQGAVRPEVVRNARPGGKQVAPARTRRLLSQGSRIEKRPGRG